MNQSMVAVPRTVAPPLDLYGPIAADLEEVERILSQTLKSRYPQVQPVVDHVRHYRGKRLRPVLLLLTARACGKVDAGPSRPRCRGRDDPHGHAGPR